MCGIAGVIAWDDRFAVDRSTLERMSARIAHRGPDGDGIWINESQTGARVGLVHRRLAIIDLDERANQPMTDGQGRWIVFNGEIYNYRDLKTQIDSIQSGHPWKTSGDTEVLLAAYTSWNDQCCKHLEGMFAFAIWDTARQTLVLGRDPMGQKPLFYWLAPGNAAIAFASEIGALLEVPWVGRAMNPAALTEYLRQGYILNQTIYESIEQLPPATFATMTARGELKQHYYFSANESSRETANESADPIAHTHRLVSDAVKSQLVADVPVGCFLSGGIDSSIIAAAMKRAVGADQRVLTFSIGFEDPRYDETKYAAAVARHLGTEHHEFIVRPDAAADLPRLASVFGQPFGDSSALPTHYLARETRQYVKVALSGDGGDELFGGYDRYRAMALAERLGSIPGPLRRALGSAVSSRISNTNPKSRWARLKRFIGSLDGAPAPRYSEYVAVFGRDLLAKILTPDLLSAAEQFRTQTLEQEYERLRNQGRNVVESALALDRVTYLPGDLLAKVDRASMLHALEVRSPFMDPTLVHFAAGLSKSQLLAGGSKQLLRRAFARELPREVFSRKKMGFAVPIGEWFRTSLRSMLRDSVLAADSFAQSHLNIAIVRQMIEEHETAAVDHSQRLYALLMLELWHKQQSR